MKDDTQPEDPPSPQILPHGVLPAIAATDIQSEQQAPITARISANVATEAISDRLFDDVSDSIGTFLENHHLIHKALIRFAVALWSTVILFSLWIWLDTIWNDYHDKPVKLFFYLSCPIFVLTLTFIYEGLEAAYTELRDKDPLQFEGGPADRITTYIRRMGQEQFFESREWAIVALLVGAALLIEQDKYFLPFLGVVDLTHKHLHDSIRILLTVALTAFALVWVAQSPGKHVARRNSVEFMSYFTRTTLVLLRFVWGILSLAGLQYPSQIADNLFLRRMSRCTTQRKLIPSDLTFYADGVKKYGYGFLISDEILTVGDEGEITLTSRTLHYVSDPRRTVKRKFHLEKEYAQGIKWALQTKDQKYFRCLAFEGPLIGERVDEAAINQWGELVYSDDPSAWRLPEGYSSYPTTAFSTSVELKPSGESNPTFASREDEPRTNFTNNPGSGSASNLLLLEMILDFGEKLPRTEGQENTKALYLFLETTVKTIPEAFPLPEDGKTSSYPYFRKHTHPCLRSTFFAHLPKTRPEIVFESPYEGENFSVTYDETIHHKEQDRFAKQKRTPAFSRKISGAPELPTTQGLGQDFVCFMDSSLPAAQYAVKLRIKNLLPIPEDGS